jgi:thiosulfate/3-mercaptopyruvate sulfurtransferase
LLCWDVVQFAGRFTEEMMVIGRVGVEIRAPRLDDGLAQQPGFGRWLAEDRPVERGPAKGYPQAVFAAKPRPGRFIGKDKVLAATKDPEFVIVDALGPQFHQGLEPSRYGRPGRIPGSVNVPAASLVDPQDKTFTSLGDAAAKFAAAGVDKDRQVICYCGGGISATVDLFLLHQLGFDNLTLYDGSMGEWAKDSVLPIEKG